MMALCLVITSLLYAIDSVPGSEELMDPNLEVSERDTAFIRYWYP